MYHVLSEWDFRDYVRESSYTRGRFSYEAVGIIFEDIEGEDGPDGPGRELELYDIGQYYDELTIREFITKLSHLTTEERRDVWEDCHMCAVEKSLMDDDSTPIKHLFRGIDA